MTFINGPLPPKVDPIVQAVVTSVTPSLWRSLQPYRKTLVSIEALLVSVISVSLLHGTAETVTVLVSDAIATALVYWTPNKGS